MYRWSPEMIRFLEDAAAKTDYYRMLAAEIGAQLAPDAQVCDVGCGLGHLAEALCPAVGGVTALDCASNAIDACRARLGKQLPDGLKLLCADAFALPAELRFDAMVFCYFGSLQDILQIAKKHCTGSVFVVRRDYPQHRFDLSESLRASPTVQQTQQALAARGIPCTAQPLAAEFGQPLRSLADAERFFSLYHRGTAPVTQAQLAARVQTSDDPAFPHYVPQRKQVVLLRFPAAAI